MEGELLCAEKLFEVSVDGEGPFEPSDGIAEHLADISHRDTAFSRGFGSRPSVVSATVLLPASGSAAFRSSVFLSSWGKAEPHHRAPRKNFGGMAYRGSAAITQILSDRAMKAAAKPATPG